MKRLLLFATTILLTGSILTGCYGKFALTRKVYEVNGQVSDKFLRSGLTWIFIFVPVYGIAALVDFIAFNTIEFWSGKNPVASGEKDFQYVKGDDLFQIHASKAGEMVDYTIQHYTPAGLADTTLITWNTKSGKSVLSTNKDGLVREYVASKDQGRIRVDQYAQGKVQDVVWYSPGGAVSAGEFASAR